MSSLIIEVDKVSSVSAHDNADLLEIVQVKGWQCISQKGIYKEGNLVAYVPPDSVLPLTLSDYMNVTKFTSNGRIRTVRLRGVISQGLLISIDTLRGYLKDIKDYQDIPVFSAGMDVAGILEITKYDPPIKVILGGETRRNNPHFVRYTDIENWKNFPDILVEGEEVVISEKLHGTNFRAGNVEPNDELDSFYVGSHNMTLKDKGNNVYVTTAKKYNLKDKIDPTQIVYSEIYGAGLQKGFIYDFTKEPGLRVFDISENGRYLNFDNFIEVCEKKGFPTVPILYRGPYSESILKSFAQGNTTLGDHMREGVVVKPTIERRDPKVGRVIFKYISEVYEETKHRKNWEDTYDH